jgi:hypothetical protein
VLAEGESGARWTSGASYWYPDYLQPSAWLDHAPFACWLMGVLRPRSLVELGTYRGYSYFVFCQAVQRLNLETRCFAVDTWKGDEHAGFYGPEVFAAVEQHNAARYSAFSRLIRSMFGEALAHFSDGSVDLLHIDGQHFYEDVKRDFSQWRPKLSERAGVLFHDTNVRERGFGVFRLWEELRREFPGFEFLHGHGLGVLGYGPQVPPALGALFAASSDAAATAEVRAIYDRLGGAIRADLDSSRARAQLAEQVKRREARNGIVSTAELTCLDFGSGLH